jgi:hypothetical protein
MRVLCLSVVLLSMSHAHAQERPREVGEAADIWSEPNPGVRYLDRRTTTPTRIHAVLVQLDAPGVSIVATTHRQRWRTVSSYALDAHVQVAVNGGFWVISQGARGLAAGGGAIWPRNGVLDPELGELIVDREGHVTLHPPGESLSEEQLAEVSEAVSGRPWLVHDGDVVTETLDTFETANDRAPRTAVGLSRDGHTLLLAVVDGRQPESRGMTLYELGRLMAELGADEAMNLDGGASSEMYVQELGGVVNIPSRGRWEIALDSLIGEGQIVRETPHGREVLTRGREQEVINHLGILAAPPPPVIATPHDALEAIAPMPPPPPLPPRVSLGPLRETLARALTFGVPAIFLLLVARPLYRRFRQRGMFRGASRRSSGG